MQIFPQNGQRLNRHIVFAVKLPILLSFCIGKNLASAEALKKMLSKSLSTNKNFFKSGHEFAIKTQKAAHSEMEQPFGFLEVVLLLFINTIVYIYEVVLDSIWIFDNQTDRGKLHDCVCGHINPYF